MIVSIHQPTYLPWTGLFHKILQSDVYVAFDDVQLPRGKDFIVRNKIKTQNGAKWLRVPVKNKSSLLPIYQAEINNEVEWTIQHWNSIYSNYFKAKYFSHYEQKFKKIFEIKWHLLVDLNLTIIQLIMQILNIKTKIIRSSELGIKSSGTEKILDILEFLHTDQYLTGCGEGSKRYLEGKEDLFQKRGIKILHQNFKHPTYPQLFGNFVSELSICDMLFNIGAESALYELNNS